MAYVALYRTYRPKNFGEVIGQKHIIKTLKNAVAENKTSHAYIFSGLRGIGKTTIARILARAVNCENPIDGEPCNQCKNCLAILNDETTDIVELDAASNNGVDEMREILEKVNFLPSVLRKKVYIIDEAHMLSTAAFNALLKTLEEPPLHVMFILATTEPQKLPATILSRCQRFDFKKISNADIEKRLNFVCKESKIDITDEAKQLIAVLAEGAMRDALSILERCLQEEGTITDSVVKELVGIPKTESVNKIVKSILEKDTQTALQSIDEIIAEGKDITNFLWEIIKYVKDILVYKVNNKLEIYNEDEKAKIKELADSTEKDRLVSIIFELSNLENDIKWSSQKLIMFQVAIIKLCNETSTTQATSGTPTINSKEIEDLQYKMNRLEKELTLMKNTKTVVNNSVQNVENKTANQPKLEFKPEIKKIDTVKLGEPVENWPKIVDQIKQAGKISLYTNLLNSTANKINDMTVGIKFERGITPFGKTILERPENMNEIVRQVSIEMAQPMRVVLLDNNDTIASSSDKFSNIAKDIDAPINIIE